MRKIGRPCEGSWMTAADGRGTSRPGACVAAAAAVRTAAVSVDGAAAWGVEAVREGAPLCEAAAFGGGASVCGGAGVGEDVPVRGVAGEPVVVCLVSSGFSGEGAGCSARRAADWASAGSDRSVAPTRAGVASLWAGLGDLSCAWVDALTLSANRIVIVPAVKRRQHLSMVCFLGSLGSPFLQQDRCDYE